MRTPPGELIGTHIHQGVSHAGMGVGKRPGSLEGLVGVYFDARFEQDLLGLIAEGAPGKYPPDVPLAGLH